jgi:hypothetical protein
MKIMSRSQWKSPRRTNTGLVITFLWQRLMGQRVHMVCCSVPSSREDTAAFRPVYFSIGQFFQTRFNEIYSRCREIIKDTLGKVGADTKCYSTHSLRSGGATAMAQVMTGNPSQSRLLRLQGQWKTDSTRDMYVKDSIDNRLLLTRTLNLWLLTMKN